MRLLKVFDQTLHSLGLDRQAKTSVLVDKMLLLPAALHWERWTGECMSWEQPVVEFPSCYLGWSLRLMLLKSLNLIQWRMFLKFP